MQDRIIAITGAASGIGRATALLCAERGAHVALMDVDEAGLKLVAQEAERSGVSAATYVCDVRDEDVVAEAFSSARRDLGTPRGLFACAGIDLPGFAHELPAERWQKVIDINLNGSFFASKHMLQGLLDSGLGGSIVLCSSPASFVSFAAGANTAYAASKGAVSALTRTLALDYARYGVRVNAVVPGPTETPLMWMAVPAEDRARLTTTIESEVPLGRLATPREQAHAVLWLLSDDSSFVTGSHLVCDGGVLAKASISV
ncbi:SDR family oxidoreductase [Nakamurella antarctica]|uniref:SDR family oxidoreductase n=1 Tax=Nakamurella antarctica TaxID=1902245 RepID=A0A3G8ZPY4_9ACTN|nr:SDR family oxidoreductase [Nakamurella antarctica]AZI58847.1 SDR family oxidoreductase [Nakamurella antarctica]